MAFLGKKKSTEIDTDFLAPRPAEDENRSHSLAEVAVDAGSIDVTPATNSIEVVTEDPILATREIEDPNDLPATRTSYSRRDSLRGEIFDQPEPAAMLTADRLIDVSPRHRPAPESGFRRFIYFLTLKSVNLGDSLKVRERKALDARISAPLAGGAKFVPVLTRKGGVGKTTVTTLLGMALALSREDRVIAIDANPDRGTLAERVSKSTRFTVRDVVNRAAAIDGFTDFSTMVSRDVTRLDVLASDSDPMLSEAFDEGDYNVVADMAARYYSVVLTDCGTG
ncbi:MAG: MinD/ParA family protein, partial [Rhodoluna sp.]